ncbi:MAG TPA: SrfA family protein [Reyranella sp.]|nr:SrfA family protein [Reyranella sp.]
MAGPLLGSDSLQRYRALGLAGDPVWRAAPQLRIAIARHLSPEHADLLAIPEADPSGRRIDWYAPFDGEVRRLADLGEAERMQVLDTVRRLHADLAGLAERMDAPQRSSAERNFARLLRHALTAPGEETLYVVGGRPVMTFWGFAADAALPGAFLTSPPRPPAPPVIPAAAVLASAPAAAMMAPRARTAWWQWLLLAALLLLLLAALAWAVRPYLPHIEPRLAEEARERALNMSVREPLALEHVRIDTLRADNEKLRLELARLTDELARRGGNCAAGVVVPGGVVVGDAANTPIERGVPDAKAGMGVNASDKMTDKGKGPAAQEPKLPDANKAPNDKGPDNKADNKGPGLLPPDQAKADQQKAEQEKKDKPKPMVVPPEARQKQDLAFLKGDWRSRNAVATATGEKDIRPSYTLDDKGKGKVSFVQQDGSTCEAPAEARWDQGKLVIEEKSNPRCSDGHTYARNIVNCDVGPDGTAQCNGRQPGDKRSYDVQIGR